MADTSGPAIARWNTGSEPHDVSSAPSGILDEQARPRRIEHAAPGRARGLPPAGRQHAGGGTTGRGHADPTPLGVEANRRNLEVAIDYAYRQRLIPRRFTVDELFDDATRGLDAT